MESSKNIEALRAPVPSCDWALFLDIDGTLLDIAPRPDAVVVPADLPAVLQAASQKLGGALAVVSGRPIDAIDHLLSPLTLPCAAEHGAIIRFADGTLLQPGQAQGVPLHWREHIDAATRDWRGVLVGNKDYGMAIHYRLAPEREEDVRALVKSVVGGDPDFEVLPARMAFEIRRRAFHKGEAVRQFMAHAPFRGRRPVFVGDDVTDEDGFSAVRQMDGLALHVEEVFAGRPGNVRAWLKSFIV